MFIKDVLHELLLLLSVKSREMDVKEKQRVAIKFCFKADISASKTVELIRKAYGDAAVSRTAIFEWHKRFREGRESVAGPQQVEPMTTSSSSSPKWSKKIEQ